MATVSSVQARKTALEGLMGGMSGSTQECPKPALKAKLSERQSDSLARAPPQFKKPLAPKPSLDPDKPTPKMPPNLPKPFQAPERSKNQRTTDSTSDSGNKSGCTLPVKPTPSTSFSKPALIPATPKPILNSDSQAPEGDASLPRKNPLPNILILGNPPPKPKRPPTVNLEMFIGNKGSLKSANTEQKTMGPPSSHPVAPPLGPNLPLYSPVARVEPELEDENYDDVGISSVPPPLPPGGHPSEKSEDEEDEETYEDIEEMSCRLPKDSRETKEQEKKREKAEKKRLEQEKKEQKEREKKKREVRKKFKISGPIQVVLTARALKDCKGGKNELSLKEGQIVEILRLSDNPGGQWLGRTQDDSYGYVKTTAVQTEDTSQTQTAGGNNNEEFPPPPTEEEIYNEADNEEAKITPSQPNLDGNNEGLGGSGGDDVYDDIDSTPFPPPPPMNSLPQLKAKGKGEEKDSKKQKKFEKEEKDFRKKFKFNGEITVLNQVFVVPVLTNKKWGNKDLPLKPGEIVDVITKPVDDKLIGRNQEGKFGYVSTSNIMQGDTEIYDDIGEGCIYDN